MSKIIYLILILSFVSCNKKKASNENLVSNKQVYEVINHILKNEFFEKTSNKYLTEEFPLTVPNAPYFGIENMDKIFSKKDIEFMKRQLDKRYYFRIDKKFIKNKEVISFESLDKLHNLNEKSEKFWQRFEKKYKAREFDAISLPIFSVDYQTVMISYGNHCGSLCGNGRTVILKKIKGKWKEIKTVNFWMS